MALRLGSLLVLCCLLASPVSAAQPGPDSYFVPPLAKAMYDAVTDSGGLAEVQALPAFQKDGHTLFDNPGGSALWGPLIDAYLSRMPGQ